MESISYVKVDGSHVAYQVVGEGELDLVWLPGWFSDIATSWETPGLGALLRDLTDLGRLIQFDKPGMGSSDRLPTARFRPLEQRTDIVTAVMDEVDCSRAALIGLSEGASYAVVTAARVPDRVSHVVAIGAWVCASSRGAPDIGIDRADAIAFTQRAAQQWGTGSLAALLAPSQEDDPLFRSSWAAMERRAASPRAVEAYGRMFAELDIRPHLSEVRAPTLVMHSAGDKMTPVAQGRYLADNIDGARYVELDSPDHLPIFDATRERVLDEIGLHLRGRVPDRSRSGHLATVVFTDMVGSTQQAAGEGDRVWHDRLDAYDDLVREWVKGYGGRVVKSTGDGTLILFDDPAAALRCASALRAEVRDLGVTLRTGVHTGKVELRGDDVAGIAVHIAARVTDQAGPGEILVSRTVRDLLLGEGTNFTRAGTHTLRDIPGTWELYAVS